MGSLLSGKLKGCALCLDGHWLAVGLLSHILDPDDGF